MIEYNAYIADIQWYNEVDTNAEQDKILLTATNYAEAMQQIDEWYGSDNIISIKLEYLHETPITIDDSIAKMLKELNDF